MQFGHCSLLADWLNSLGKFFSTYKAVILTRSNSSHYRKLTLTFTVWSQMPQETLQTSLSDKIRENPATGFILLAPSFSKHFSGGITEKSRGTCVTMSVEGM